MKKEIVDLHKQFKVKKNKDAKRWEFRSINNDSVSYTVHFKEAETIEDAYISVLKATQKSHGGKRKGAGRKPKEPTKTIRVPLSLLPKIELIISKHRK